MVSSTSEPAYMYFDHVLTLEQALQLPDAGDLRGRRVEGLLLHEQGTLKQKLARVGIGILGENYGYGPVHLSPAEYECAFDNG